MTFVWIGLAVIFAPLIVIFLGSPFLLSSRISREEEAEEYRIFLERLRALHNRNAANDREHQEPSVRLVQS